MKLEDLRRATSVDDRAAYEAAYAEADQAGRVAEIVYGFRTMAGLTKAALAERLGVAEEEVVGAEEGTLAAAAELFRRLGRGAGPIPTSVHNDDVGRDGAKRDAGTT